MPTQTISDYFWSLTPQTRAGRLSRRITPNPLRAFLGAVFINVKSRGIVTDLFSRTVVLVVDQPRTRLSSGSFSRNPNRNVHFRSVGTDRLTKLDWLIRGRIGYFAANPLETLLFADVKDFPANTWFAHLRAPAILVYILSDPRTLSINQRLAPPKLHVQVGRVCTNVRIGASGG